MKFYINKFGSDESAKKFDNYDDFIAEIENLVGKAIDNGEQAFEILWDAGNDNE